MTGQLMRGNTNVRKCIEDFLSAKVPGLIAVARTQWELEDHMLPLPLRYDSYDPLQTTEFPTIGSLVSRTSNWNMVDLNAHAEEVYDATYSIRLFMWCRTPQKQNGEWVAPIYDAALKVRDDLSAIVRSAILHTPSLGKPGVCRVLSGTLTEDYLDAMKGASGASWLAGVLWTFDLQFSEANYEPVIVESIETTEVEVQKMSVTTE